VSVFDVVIYVFPHSFLLFLHHPERLIFSISSNLLHLLLNSAAFLCFCVEMIFHHTPTPLPPRTNSLVKFTGPEAYPCHPREDEAALFQLDLCNAFYTLLNF